MVLLATSASVIASEAVISGAFSVTRQAIQLGYLPRMTIVHTSEQEIGQIYIPVLNWTLGLFVMALVLGFQTSSNLASAYGIAVTGTMIIDAVLIALVMTLLWRWPLRLTAVLIGFFPARGWHRHLRAADHLERGSGTAEGGTGARRHSR